MSLSKCVASMPILSKLSTSYSLLIFGVFENWKALTSSLLISPLATSRLRDTGESVTALLLFGGQEHWKRR
jgi:hypothetical protein